MCIGLLTGKLLRVLVAQLLGLLVQVESTLQKIVFHKALVTHKDKKDDCIGSTGINFINYFMQDICNILGKKV